MDPHIFADPDPGSQNLADPTDPDPKHWDDQTHQTYFFVVTQITQMTCSNLKIATEQF